MKTALVALSILASSAVWADKPAVNPAGEAKAAEPVAAPPGDFCGQRLVLGWFLKTAIGQQMQRSNAASSEQVQAHAAASAAIKSAAEAEKEPAEPAAAEPEPK